MGILDRLRGKKAAAEYDPGDLKGRVLDFARSDRFKEELTQAIKERFGVGPGGTIVADEDEIDNFFDWFALERPTRSGKTPLELFVEEERRKGMPEEVCRQLLRWKNVIEGLFEVRKLLDRDTILARELLSGREYVVKSNIPGFVAENLVPGQLLFSRIVPWYDHYYFSGVSTGYPPEAKEEILKLTEGVREEWPELTLDKEELERALAAQEEIYRAFVEFFGDDEVVFATGREMAERMREFYRYYIFEHVWESTGKTVAQQAREEGVEPQLPEEEYPPEFLEARDVGVLIDPKEGIFTLLRYGTFRRIFTEEDFESIPGYRQLIYDYLKEDSIPPLPFQRMVERYPEQAKKVFKAALHRRKFKLKRDFARLMRRYKRKWLEREPGLWVTLISPRAGSSRGD